MGRGVIWRKVKILVELKELNSGKIYPILMMGGGRSREKRRIEIIELLKNKSYNDSECDVYDEGGGGAGAFYSKRRRKWGTGGKSKSKNFYSNGSDINTR